ncbi:hypothetical protein WEI85_02210 [Actinomycetes bacterium KLBMP 9797]
MSKKVPVGAIIPVVAVCVAVMCVGYLWRATDGPRDAARAYFEVLGAGDGDDACQRMTRSFQREMTSRWSAGECAGAVSAMLADLSGAERKELGETGTSSVTVTGGNATVDVRGNPLGIVTVRLAELDGEWLVAGHQ